MKHPTSIVVLAVLSVLSVAVLPGCALFHGHDAEVQVSGLDSGKINGCLNTAQDRLQMTHRGVWKVQAREGTHNRGGGRCPTFWAVLWGNEGGNQEWRGGWTSGTPSEQNTVIVTAPDGSLTECEMGSKGVHEAARAVLYSNGIQDEAKQEQLMRAAGVW